MTAKKAGGPQNLPPVFRLAPPGEINAYVVYEHELDNLAGGSPASLSLNFALALLSAAFTLAATLFTTKIGSDRVFQSFVLVLTATSIIGLFLLCLWWRLHVSTRGLVERIKLRMPPAPSTQEPPPPPSP